MARPCSPLARAAAIKSSGLETPSPEKNECECRSILNGILGRLIWRRKNGKRQLDGADGACETLGCGALLNQRVNQHAWLCRFFFFVAMELHVIKPPIIARFLEQLAMRSNFLDVPLVHYDNLVGR